MTWTIVTLSPRDIDDVMSIEVPVFGADAWSDAVVRAELASAHCWYIGARAESDGSLAGYAGALCPPGAHQADIQTIAVREQDRGHGLGRTFMTLLLDECRRRGAGEVFLEVRADNPVAHALYTSLGFQDIARRENYYQPDGVAAIVMRLTFPPTTGEDVP